MYNGIPFSADYINAANSVISALSLTESNERIQMGDAAGVVKELYPLYAVLLGIFRRSQYRQVRSDPAGLLFARV